MKKIVLTMVVCTLLIFPICMAAVSSADTANAAGRSEWGIEHFNKLDACIGWYVDAEHSMMVQDYQIDQEKPTVIYVHGWAMQGGSGSRSELVLGCGYREQLAKGYNPYKYDQQVFKEYIKKGYNVGVFFWNQLADAEGRNDINDGIPDISVDKKIWFSSMNGKNIMTYMTYDSVGPCNGVLSAIDDPTNPKDSVAVMFAKELIETLGESYDKEIRLVGHSMGGQVVMGAADYLCHQYDLGNIGKNLLPARVTIVDPFIQALSPIKATVTLDTSGKTYEYDPSDPHGANYTCIFMADAIESVGRHGIPIEGYMVNPGAVVRNYLATAILGLGKEKGEEITKKIKENVVWVYFSEIYNYFGRNSGPAHGMVLDAYFATVYQDPICSNEGLTVPCFNMPSEELYKEIGLTFIQSVETGNNPYYYDESAFSVIDFASLNAFAAGECPVVVGKANISGENNSNIVAKLLNSDGEAVGETTIDMAGYYRFYNLNEGKYTIIVTLGEEVLSEQEVSLSAEKSVPATLDEISITIKAAEQNQINMLHVWIALGVFAVVLICILGIIIKSNFSGF